jgi:hypothetical protein
MELRDVQSRLAAAHLYAGKVDGDIGGLIRDAVQAYLLQQGVRNFDAWPIARRVLAAHLSGCSTSRQKSLMEKPKCQLTQR